MLIATIGILLTACGPSGASESQPFVVAETEEQVWKALSSRYEIEAWEGFGLPGSPTANVKLENARSVLQTLIDKCGIGAATLVEASDGVITLHPEDQDLSSDQVSCIRSYEQPGLVFRDREAP
jgi:hypothetical protein